MPSAVSKKSPEEAVLLRHLLRAGRRPRLGVLRRWLDSFARCAVHEVSYAVVWRGDEGLSPMPIGDGRRLYLHTVGGPEVLL